MPAPLPEPPPQPEPGASWFMQVEPLKQQLTATLTAMLTQWASVYDHSCWFRVLRIVERIYTHSPQETHQSMIFVATRMLQTAAIPSGFWNLALNPTTWQMAVQFIILMSASHINCNRDRWHSFNVHVFIHESMYFFKYFMLCSYY